MLAVAAILPSPSWGTESELEHSSRLELHPHFYHRDHQLDLLRYDLDKHLQGASFDVAKRLFATVP